ncbi:outer membrane protein assembly factor BamB [Haloactinopolyspora alba]|uniref:Outer membrane protein assembly factor BamB n=1 Tax=Haloactinopolyspora alba TaxID=648780 RepID=A0A2P8E2C6_9ACTN|nr:S8 family serine peptidase [Haloactinopolyspora alba]PSL03557.1 outer membrane protein assembly factor BamB [Haloactinopolyspora alba]
MQPATHPIRQRWARRSTALAAAAAVLAAMAPSGTATESGAAESGAAESGGAESGGAESGAPHLSTPGGVELAEAAGVEVTEPVQETTTRPDAGETATYVVQMALEPVVTYDGDVEGLPATRPRDGEKVDPAAPKVVDYADHLKGRQRAALAQVDADEPLYHYVYAFDGFAAELTEAQAADLTDQSEVVAVRKDERYEVDTSSTPSFLGLDDGGLWDQLGGPDGGKRTPGAGEDVVIGVIDSGIWPDVRSFSDRDEDGKLVYQPQPDGFHGRCESAEKVGDDSWDANLCNNKLVAARHFNAAWGGDEGLAERRPWEFASPRDYNGHGTHTASTAGGNHDVDASGPAELFGSISGIAPRARIAAYKALWSTEDGSTANGYLSDLVAAIDQAVADGVDVINYSVSGTSTDFLDPVELAFLNAADAGVFVAASAGNSGPGASTVAHPSPWVTTVAAGTHDRVASAEATLGSGDVLAGASVAASAVGPAPLVDGADAGLDGADATEAARCYSEADNGGEPVLDPAKVEGSIVLCERGGEVARVNKSQAVADAGGIGVILVNSAQNSLNADFHVVPTVHLADTELADLRAYAATEGATATLGAATIGSDAEAPYTASFSSRGPLRAGGGDLLKPDVIAPGQDILAAVAPPGHDGRKFGLSSGTSMSAPHVAGTAALLSDLHPEWSPMAIKSALMTTGSDVLDGEPTDPSVIFSQGAGHVEPTTAADPGLVYDSDSDDWLAFLCGATSGVVQSVCDDLEEAGHSLEPTDLNVPSIGIGLLNGSGTVTRQVTNVSGETSTYTASVDGLDGFDVAVEPSTLTLDPGETAEFTVTFTHVDAELLAYRGGQLTWTDGTQDVRSPIVLRGRGAGEEDWEARYDGPSNFFGDSADGGRDLILHPDGERLYMSGVSNPPLPGTLVSDMLTAAYDPETGDELWMVRYDGSDGGSDEPGGFGVSPDGEVVYVAAASGGDFVTIAYDGATGEELWLTRLDGPGAGSDVVNGLAVGPDGETVYVTGYQNMGGNELDYATVAYDAATGDQRWVSHYDDPVQGTDDARDVAVSADGSTVIVTGQSRGFDTGLTDWGTVAYDAATGAEKWEVLHNGDADSIDIPSTVAIQDGTVVVAGSVRNDDTATDWNVVGYDLATGEQRWASEYDGPDSYIDTPRAQAFGPDGDVVVVTGNTEGEGTNGDYTTIAYDVATGEQRWVTRHSGSANGLDIAWDVAVTDDGTHAVVTGYSDETDTEYDYLTIAYDLATGEKAWSTRYDATTAGDAGSAVVVDSVAGTGRRVFVTGQSSIATNPMRAGNVDATTLAYFDPFG